MIRDAVISLLPVVSLRSCWVERRVDRSPELWCASRSSLSFPEYPCRGAHLLCVQSFLPGFHFAAMQYSPCGKPPSTKA